ncbi:MAG: SLBB domain-containing protein [Bacillota bacterium]
MPAMAPADIIAAIRNAGVVGAGGAGFPTHVKLSATVDTVIANGAECEPLLAADQAVMLLAPEKVVAGLRIAMKATGAQQGFVAVKRKHDEALRAMREAVSLGNGIKGVAIFELDDVYPVGDEHVLVHEVTGRYVPEGGLPLEVGVVVSNVATLANVADAVEGRPVTSRLVTVSGAVARPLTARFPIGTPVAAAIELAGGPVVERYRIIMGGPVMGKLAPDASGVITKLTAGIIVLPADHPLVKMREDELKVILKRARAACCQCMSCTETCPRHLLGHRISPHLIMRAMSMSLGAPPEAITSAWLCSECGVCAIVGCPAGLAPVRVNQALKQSMAGKGIKNPYHNSDILAHPMRGSRRVHSSRLAMRAGIAPYAGHYAPGMELFIPDRVDIPLLQHVGAPAVPRVRPGDEVMEGDLVADIPEGKIGARVHASISGVVSQVSGVITIVAGRGRR